MIRIIAIVALVTTATLLAPAALACPVEYDYELYPNTHVLVSASNYCVMVDTTPPFVHLRDC